MNYEQFSEEAKRRIRISVRLAVKEGRLAKSDTCETCGVTGERWYHGLHAHHNDYAKPLEVLWLCPPCHGGLHRRLGWGSGGLVSKRIRTGRKQVEIDALYAEHRRELRARCIPLPKDEVTS